MKKTAWKKRIKEACIKAGTDREFFDYTIETRADILGKRDDAARAYLDYGAEPLIAYYAAREAECRNLRIAVSAVHIGLPAAAAKERMRELYV